MISTITNQGKVRFMFYKEKMNSDMLIKFLKRLVKGADKKVFLILDNSRVHYSKVVKAWLVERKNEIEIFYLPGYSPDLNPDEYLNNDLKCGISLRPVSRHNGRLEKNAKKHMHSIQKQPKRMRKLFQAKSIHFAC